MDDPLPSLRFSIARRAVATVALCWLSFLFWLAATTGNPVVLNKVQLLTSDCVLTCEVSGGKVTHIFHVWKGEVPELPVCLPDDMRLRDGWYIIPLVTPDNQPVVTPLPLRSDGEMVRIVYPMTDGTLQQLYALFGK